MSDSLVVIDLETTGIFGDVQLGIPEIIEIGAVKLDAKDGKISTFEEFVKPVKAIPEFIEELTGIGNEMVEDSMDIKEALGKLERFCGGKSSLLAAWPTSFEIPLLQYWYGQSGYDSFPLDRRALDIGSAARMVFLRFGLSIIPVEGAEPVFNLANVCNTLQIEMQETKHRALPDALTEFDVYKYVSHAMRSNI